MIGGTDTLSYVRQRCGQFRCPRCERWTFQAARGQSHCARCEALDEDAGTLRPVIVTAEHVQRAREALGASAQLSAAALAELLGWSGVRARAVLQQLVLAGDVEVLGAGGTRPVEYRLASA